jgi:hypothetical protein
VSGVQFRALGVAEHLDDSVWQLPDGELPGLGNPGALLAFAQVACHQRVYATLAAFFANNSSLASLQTGPGVPISPLPNSNYAYWGTAFNTGFGAAPSYSGPVAGSTADRFIQEIYGWDAFVTSGTSHSTGVGSLPFPPLYDAGAASVGTPYQYAGSC